MANSEYERKILPQVAKRYRLIEIINGHCEVYKTKYDDFNEDVISKAKSLSKKAYDEIQVIYHYIKLKEQEEEYEGFDSQDFWKDWNKQNNKLLDLWEEYNEIFGLYDERRELEREQLDRDEMEEIFIQSLNQ
jgi:hypothetical protein